MHVVDHPSPDRLEHDAHGNEFRIVEVVDISLSV